MQRDWHGTPCACFALPVWQQDWARLQEQDGKYLEISTRHHIRTMFVLFWMIAGNGQSANLAKQAVSDSRSA